MAIIGKIRSRVGLLIGSIAGAIALFLISDALSNGQLIANKDANVAGRIHGQEISFQDYEKTVQQAEANYAQRSGMEVTEELRYQLRQQAWEKALQDAVTKSEFEKLGIAVSDEELRQLLYEGGDNVHQSIRTAPIFLNELGKFDKNKVAQYVQSFKNPNDPEAAQRQQQWASFEKSIYEDQLTGKYTALVSKAVYVPNFFAKKDFENKNQKANVQYVSIPYTTVDDASIQVTDSDLDQYIREHKNEFKNEATRSLEYIAVPITASTADVINLKESLAAQALKLKETNEEGRFLKTQYSETPYTDKYLTATELKTVIADTTLIDSVFARPVGTVIGPVQSASSFYVLKVVGKKAVADSAQIRVIVKQPKAQAEVPKAKKELDSLKNLIKNGANFATIADSFSDDKTQKGGDWGYIKPTDKKLDQFVIDSIFHKYNVGDLFVIPGQRAFYLINIVKAPASKTGAKVAILNKTIQPSSTTSDSILAIVNKVVGESKDLESFRAAAKKYNYPTKTASDMPISGYQIQGLGIASEVIDWAFQNKTGSVSQRAFQVDQRVSPNQSITHYVVPAITSSKNKGLPSAADVRTRLEGKIKQDKKAAEIIKKLAGETDINKIASTNGQTVQTIADLAFIISPGVDNPLANEPKVVGTAAGMQPNTTSKPIAGRAGVYVIKLNSLTPAAETPEGVTASKQSLLQTFKGAVSSTLLQSIIKDDNISDNRYRNREK